MKRVFFAAYSLGSLNGADQSALDVLSVLNNRDDIVVDVAEQVTGPLVPVKISGQTASLRMSSDPGNFVDRNYMRDMLSKFIQDLKNTQRLKKMHNQPYDLLVSNEFSAQSWLPFVQAKERICILRNSPKTYAGEYKGCVAAEAGAPMVSCYSQPIAVSERTGQLWDNTGALSEKCCVIPNCGPEDECAVICNMPRRKLRQKLGFNTGPMIVCVASIQYRKGQDILLNAWAEVKARFPTAQLALVGPPVFDSWYASFRHALEKYADVLEPGAVSNPLEYIAAADLLVLPSRDEALPRTVLEAMLLKTPVVATRVAGIPEMIINDETGLLSDAENSAQLAGQIIRMLDGRELQARCTDNAYKHYWAHYSRKVFSMRWNTLLDQIL